MIKIHPYTHPPSWSNYSVLITLGYRSSYYYKNWKEKIIIQNHYQFQLSYPLVQVLADYEAGPGTSRELSLTEGEVVRLVKIGCAGWWWVTEDDQQASWAYHPRYVKCGDREGWAPSTYLQILPGNTKTLDRRSWMLMEWKHSSFFIQQQNQNIALLSWLWLLNYWSLNLLQQQIHIFTFNIDVHWINK